MRLKSKLSLLMMSIALVACGGDSGGTDDSNSVLSFASPSNTPTIGTNQGELSEQLDDLLQAAAPGRGAAAFALPNPTDLEAIPQDPSNPLTEAKIELGRFLFHETALAQNSNNPDMKGTYSCASCHHADAGFKSGVMQGIGEGGSGFGLTGESRRMADGFDAMLPDSAPMKPDVQPVASPTILNSAYQEVMLWNGQFGNPIGGQINSDIDAGVLSTEGTPKAANARHLSGVETQAVAGLGVHRLNVETNSPLQANTRYRDLFTAAYPNGSTDVLEDAAKAIAAFERSVLANEAPFQRWLQGDRAAMSDSELRGAAVFFGEGSCASCHRGPGLSSEENALEEELFFAVGFADFDTGNELIAGVVDENVSKGRGGFTGKPEDNYKFKIPQLYNLADTTVFGHGASFSSIREVVEYKNAATPAQVMATDNLDERFRPLGLSEAQIDDLTSFLSNALYDTNLERYVPETIPSGNCFPVNDVVARNDLGCP